MPALDLPASAVLAFLDEIDPPEADDYLADPVKWVTDNLGEFLWSKQRRIMESVRDNRVTAVPSCHDSGKSFIAARVAAWWIACHPPGTAKVVSTAPTFPQVKGILWQEIGTAYNKGKLPGRVTQTEWYVAHGDHGHYSTAKPGEYLAGFGRKPADNNPVGFSGIHAEYVLFIIDEADGVAETMWGAARTALTNAGARLLAIGNPDNPSSTFAERVKSSLADPDADEYVADSGAYVIRIDGLQTPNFTDEPVPDALRPMLLSPEWVEETVQLYGEDSPYYIAKVRGRHPADNSSGVIPHSWVRNNMVDRAWTKAQLTPTELGIDVGASDNGDQTVVRERRGPLLGRVWRFRERDHTKLAPKLLNIITETGATSVKIDATGAGHGLANMLTAYGAEGRHGAVVHEINFGASAVEATRFANVRAELHWGFRELVQTNAADLSGLRDEAGGEKVVAELIAPTYEEDTTGRVRVEKKAEVAKRLKRSPDDADAVFLAYYMPPTVAGDMEIVSDW